MLYMTVKKNTTHTMEYLPWALISVSFSREEIAVAGPSEVEKRGRSTVMLKKATES